MPNHWAEAADLQQLSPWAAVLQHVDFQVFPRPTPGIRFAGSILGVAASLSVLLAVALLARINLGRTSPLGPERPRSRAPWRKIETPAGTLFVLDSTRVFAYLSALSGLVFLAGSVLSLLAPPSVTAQTALICLVQVFLVLIGSSIALASVQSVWRARLPITVWRRKSPVATNNLCLFGVGALVAVTVASGIVRTVGAHHLDASLVKLRAQLNARVAAQVEATPAAMLQLAPYIVELRKTADRLRISVLTSQTVNVAVSLALVSACLPALRMQRSPRSTVTEAPIQLPLTPPAFETKHNPWPGFSVSETSSLEDGIDTLGGEEGCAAKARDDLVLICSLVGSIAVVSSVASLLALMWAAVPELYWAHVTTRRSLELVVPLVAIFAQLVALGFLFRETFRPHVSSSFELSTAVATGTTASDAAYRPLSTRMIHLSRRGKVRWSRVRFWPRRGPQMPDMTMMSEATDMKQHFVLSDDDASSSVGSSRPSTPSSGDDSSSTPSRADDRPRHGLLI
ncbi:hypothetical protein RHOSPDRAFT_25645 [Rhodotorula sp. JG-1b]|nr:hypothetical protein RHOSPDRAFT_25645 [Rhodotorula sp. JG-1b]